MRKPITLAVATLALLAGCGAAPAPSARATRILALSGSAAAGGTVYLIYTCGSCHGTDGKGTISSRNVSLVAKVQALTAGEFVDFILDGVPGTEMVAYGTPTGLTDQQVADVYAYVKTVLAQ